MIKPLIKDLIKPLVKSQTGDQPLFSLPLENDLILSAGVGDVTFTRASSATYLDPVTGLITNATTNEARFEANGLLIEDASENLILRSEEIDNIAWTKNSGVTITPNTGAGADGTTTADQAVYNGTINQFFEQGVTASASADVTFSIWIRRKAGTLASNGNAQITMYGAGMSTTTKIFIGDAFNAQNTTDLIRYEVNGTASVGGGAVNCTVRFDDAVTLEAWGAQFEEKKFATSYMKTEGSTVTRAADVLTVDSDNIPTIGQDYSISCEFDQISVVSGATNRLYEVAGETSRKATIGADINATEGAVTSTDVAGVTGSLQKFCFTVGSTNQTLYIDGVQQDQDAKGTPTGTKTAINIGRQSTTDYLNGHIKKVKIFDRELNQAEIDNL